VQSINVESSDSRPRLARVAGLLYLVIIVCGVWSDGFVRSQLVVAGDAAQTAERILGAQNLFRLSFVADSVMVLCDVALAVLLYELLRPVNKLLASLATAFRLTQAAVLGLNLLNQHLTLALLTAPHGAFEDTERNTLALLFAEAQAYGYDLGLLFFGINCLITGYLVFKSGFLPRAIGLLVAASGPVYLAGSYLRFLAPDVATTIQLAYVLPLLAESALCVWLLIRGTGYADAPRVILQASQR
jgi:ABC-type uncharacterized transport system permease subunit